MRLLRLAVILSLTLAPHAVNAQQAGKVYRIGWMTTGPLALIVNFREGMRELGYVEGQNVVIEQRYGRPERLPELAEELTRLKVDLIVASGSASARGWARGGASGRRAWHGPARLRYPTDPLRRESPVSDLPHDRG